MHARERFFGQMETDYISFDDAVGLVQSYSQYRENIVNRGRLALLAGDFKTYARSVQLAERPGQCDSLCAQPLEVDASKVPLPMFASRLFHWLSDSAVFRALKKSAPSEQLSRLLETGKRINAEDWELTDAERANAYDELDVLLFYGGKECFEVASKRRNEPDMAALLGLCYLRGIGVEKNEIEGLQILMDAARSSAFAQYCLADDEDDSDWYELAARNGSWKARAMCRHYTDWAPYYRMCQSFCDRFPNHPAAIYGLGLCYWDGRGVKSDRAKARELIRKAAERGDAGARYKCGSSIERDAAKEVEWYRKAAEQGHADAQNSLGWMYEHGRGVGKDEAKAVEWYRKAAEQGEEYAQCNLGKMYANGRGVEQDDAKAVKWYRKSAEQGHARAQNSLGWMYANGRGVEKDDAKAVEWFRKAAEQGDADAQNNLGVMYANGRGVKQDEAKAVEWYRKAAEQGHARAQFNLGCMYANGRGVEKDEAKAVEWYRKAAEQGHARAQNNLGWGYENGRGVEKDEAKAVEWYRKAARQGDETAQDNLRVRNLSW